MVEEIFMTQFIASTTCYSGARDSNSSLSLATETHILKLMRGDNSNHSNAADSHVETLESLCNDQQPSSNIVASDTICVGHSNTALVDGGECHAICLLKVENPQQQQQQQSTDPSLNSATQPSHHRRSHPRRLTHDGTLMMNTTTTSDTTTTANNSTSNSLQRASWTHHQFSAMTTIDETAAARSGSTTNKNYSLVKLLVKSPIASSTNNNRQTIAADNSSIFYTSQPLMFRPLAPCVCQLVVVVTTRDIHQSSNDGDAGDCDRSVVVTVVWTGSSDDNLLHLFLPLIGNGGDGTTSLKERRLDHTGFKFDSPVMALAFFHTNKNMQQLNDGDNKKHYRTNDMAVACQDGTIRLLGFECHGLDEHDWEFANVQEYTVIVDGPIVCLDWNSNLDSQVHGATMQVVAGSLCGYVCSLQRTTNGQAWQGPTMIAQGFWDHRLQTEDSILAVTCCGNHVAFGTYSGKVWVYHCHSPLSGEYTLAWHCQLHYPIHAVSFLSEQQDKSSSSTSFLMITTRRTLHILKNKQSSLSSQPQQPRYSAELAKQRLQRLIMANRNLTCYTESVSPDNRQSQDDNEADAWILL